LSFSNVTLAPIEVTNKHGKKIVPFREDKFFVNSFPSKFFLRANAPNAHIMNNLATARNAARNISRNKVIYFFFFFVVISVVVPKKKRVWRMPF
tara:strand:+ start:321 stop:602 length:282 start_codon:yes stop_codon:yes gene_type:complete